MAESGHVSCHVLVRRESESGFLRQTMHRVYWIEASQLVLAPEASGVFNYLGCCLSLFGRANPLRLTVRIRRPGLKTVREDGVELRIALD